MEARAVCDRLESGRMSHELRLGEPSVSDRLSVCCRDEPKGGRMT
jgi:hypothetical protein